jgi:hypothetical protein
MTPDNPAPCSKQTQAEGANKTTKKPYQKPAFRYERVFETLALACGKVGSSTPQCQFSRKSS